jgi:hypothetical protein
VRQDTKNESAVTKVLNRAKQTNDVIYLVRDKEVLRTFTRQDAEEFDRRGILKWPSVIGVYNKDCDRDWILDDIEYVMKRAA